jgi:retron-type reverse transcriptase
MFDDSSFPDSFKIARVIPVHKKGSKTAPENYRQISILPTISKIFEKVLFMQLGDFFETNKLYDELQYGFRAGRGCHYAICKVLTNVSKELDVGGLRLDET